MHFIKNWELDLTCSPASPLPTQVPQILACKCLIKLVGKKKKKERKCKTQRATWHCVHAWGRRCCNGRASDGKIHTGQRQRRLGFIICTAHELTHLSFLKIQQSQAPISQSLWAGWRKLVLPQQKVCLPSPPIPTTRFEPSYHLLSS